jgi:hypothetical protein
MIVSFDIQELEDLELLLSLTKRLGIKKVETEFVNKSNSVGKRVVSSHESNDFNEINGEINSIFGIDNSDISF